MIAHHGVEDWLGRVESGMRATIRRLILKHVEDDLDLPTSELPLQASTLFMSFLGIVEDVWRYLLNLPFLFVYLFICYIILRLFYYLSLGKN